MRSYLAGWLEKEFGLAQNDFEVSQSAEFVGSFLCNSGFGCTFIDWLGIIGVEGELLIL